MPGLTPGDNLGLQPSPSKGPLTALPEAISGTRPPRPPLVQPPGLHPGPVSTPRTITRYWAAPQEFSERREPYVVLLETAFRSGVFAAVNDAVPVRVTQACDGRDSTATIRLSTDSERLSRNAFGALAAPLGVGDRHITHLVDEFRPDRRVVVRQVDDARSVVFDGYVTQTGIDWGDGGQGVTLTCVSRPEVLTETAPEAMVFGRYMRKNPPVPYFVDDGEAVLTGWPLHFNPPGKRNRSRLPVPTAIPISGGETIEVPVYVFTSEEDPTAEPWTLAQALIYLMRYYGNAISGLDLRTFWLDMVVLATHAPVPTSTDLFLRRITTELADERHDASSLRAIVTALCTKQSLHVAMPLVMQEAPAAGGSRPQPNTDWRHELRIWTRGASGAGRHGEFMGRPEAFDLPRDPPFKAIGTRHPNAVAQANATDEASLRVDRRATARLTTLGGRVVHEVTLYLRPGWIPFTAANAQHYPGVVIPTPNVVDDVVFDQEIKEYWGPYINSEKDEDGHVLSIWHPQHAEHWRVADVLRTWVFPTDHRRQDGYVPAGLFGRAGWPSTQYRCHDGSVNVFALPSPEGCGLAAELTPWLGAAEWVSTVRLIREMIGRDGWGTTRAPVVEWSSDGGDSWVPLKGLSEVEFLPNECGLYFVAETLSALAPPGDELLDDDGDAVHFLYAYLKGRLRVRVTCCIESDARRVHVEPERPLSHARPTAGLSDTGERYRYLDRSTGNSVIYHRLASADLLAREDWTFKDIDTSEKLLDAAAREAEHAAEERTSGNPRLWWVQPMRLGDLITGVAGLQITFPQPAEVLGVSYTFSPETTTLELGD